MDKAHEQAIETRRRNAELRKAGMEAREAERKQDEALVMEALRAILKDPEASTEQRIFAVSVLDNMKNYSIVPYGIKNGTKSDDLIADFARQLEASKKV